MFRKYNERLRDYFAKKYGAAETNMFGIWVPSRYAPFTDALGVYAILLVIVGVTLWGLRQVFGCP
jgi:hypothetical protein